MENISYTYYYVQCMWSYMYTHSEKTRIPHYQDHTLGHLFFIQTVTLYWRRK